VKADPPGVPPFVKAQKTAPVPVVDNWRVSPAIIAVALLLMVRVGNGVMLRFETAGHEVMKADAKVKTVRTPSGVSKADGTAALFEAIRINV
jgi:hypothetical protein